eukprot:2791165-Rhodomonas_salina.1
MARVHAPLRLFTLRPATPNGAMTGAKAEEVTTLAANTASTMDVLYRTMSIASGRVTSNTSRKFVATGGWLNWFAYPGTAHQYRYQ